MDRELTRSFFPFRVVAEAFDGKCGPPIILD
jgi:hypothetical protein